VEFSKFDREAEIQKAVETKVAEVTASREFEAESKAEKDNKDKEAMKELKILELKVMETLTVFHKVMETLTVFHKVFIPREVVNTKRVELLK